MRLHHALFRVNKACARAEMRPAPLAEPATSTKKPVTDSPIGNSRDTVSKIGQECGTIRSSAPVQSEAAEMRPLDTFGPPSCRSSRTPARRTGTSQVRCCERIGVRVLEEEAEVLHSRHGGLENPFAPKAPRVLSPETIITER